MITREEAVQALRQAGCSEEVVRHCITVEKIALLIARKIHSDGHKVDVDFVSRGALLHDIGRARSHGVGHGVEGGKVLRELELEKLARVAECHVGAGIPAGEAKELGLSEKNLMPHTVEEKIVTYADKLAMGRRRVSYWSALEAFKSDLGPEHPAVKRFKRLHDEVQHLMKKGGHGK